MCVKYVIAQYNERLNYLRIRDYEYKVTVQRLKDELFFADTVFFPVFPCWKVVLLSHARHVTQTDDRKWK